MDVLDMHIHHYHKHHGRKPHPLHKHVFLFRIGTVCLFFALLLLSIAIVFFVLGLPKQIPASEEQVHVTALSVQNTPVATQVEEDRLYENNQLSFSFRYPKQWRVDMVDPYYLRILPTASASNAEISIKAKPYTKTVDAYMQEIHPEIGRQYQSLFVSLTPVAIAGELGMRGRGNCCDISGEHIFVQHDNHVYDISYISSNNSSATESASVFQKVLTSLRFTQ